MVKILITGAIFFLLYPATNIHVFYYKRFLGVMLLEDFRSDQNSSLINVFNVNVHKVCTHIISKFSNNTVKFY